MRVLFSVDNAAAISQAFFEAPAMVLEELETTMLSVTAYVMGQAQERTPTSEGTLRNAFIARVTTSQYLDAVFGEVTNPLPYALPVELGTKPHYPPIAPLEDWVTRHLDFADHFGGDIYAAAKAIQRKIGRQGTPGYGMLHFALRDGRSTIEAEFAECTGRIQRRLAATGDGSGSAA